jgi:hypothetical protein
LTFESIVITYCWKKMIQLALKVNSKKANKNDISMLNSGLPSIEGSLCEFPSDLFEG